MLSAAKHLATMPTKLTLRCFVALSMTLTATRLPLNYPYY